MGKNTRKPPAPRKPKNTPLPLSSPTLVAFAKHKLIRKQAPRPPSSLQSERVASLINQEVLTCSICLQLLLSPVQAQCGHSFCLSCAEDLASNGFACGICHSHQPSYDLPGSKTIQALIQSHLSTSQSLEQEQYNKRMTTLKIKETRRLIGDVEAGDSIDFWCDSTLAWKSGTVTNTMKNGILTITPKRGGDDFLVSSSSRKLAPNHFFTKEEELPHRHIVAPDMQIRPLHMLPSRASFENTVRMGMGQRPRMMGVEQRPRMMGMPLILGYYIRGGEEGLDRNSMFDGLDPFNF